MKFWRAPGIAALILLVLATGISGCAEQSKDSNAAAEQEMAPEGTEAKTALAHPADVLSDFPAVNWEADREENIEILKSEGHFPESVSGSAVAFETRLEGADAKVSLTFEGAQMKRVEVVFQLENGKGREMRTTFRNRLVEQYGSPGLATEPPDLESWYPGSPIVVSQLMDFDGEGPLQLSWSFAPELSVD